MLLQAVLWMASLAALTAAILGSALVATRAALHETVAAKTRLATNDAVAAMTRWARTAVEQDGARVDWQTLPASGRRFSESLCVSATAPCGLTATATWTVTGDTARAAAPASAPSLAQDMTAVIDEQRFSATVSVNVANADGTAIGSAVRVVTLRAFDAAPYVVVTAAKDRAEMSGEAAGSEGDSAGAAGASTIQNAQFSSGPDATHPAAYTDTQIHATVDCANTAGTDEVHPAARSNQATAILASGPRPDGTLQWAYQLQCTPVTLPNAPANARNYVPPQGATYYAEPSAESIPWTKGDRTTGGFAP